MIRKLVLTLGAAVITVSALAIAQSTDKTTAAKRAFADVYRVLESPRCMNCHPAGNAPLQTDRSLPHKQNISRATVTAGVPCSTCHQERNSEAVGVDGGPPGGKGWNLPAADMPLVFQGKTPTQLCEQLKDPERNGHRTLAQLVEHVEHEPLVLWGWAPGGKRTVPPLSHDAFVDAVKTWVAGDGACP